MLEEDTLCEPPPSSVHTCACTKTLHTDTSIHINRNHMVWHYSWGDVSKHLLTPDGNWWQPKVRAPLKSNSVNLHHRRTALAWVTVCEGKSPEALCTAHRQRPRSERSLVSSPHCLVYISCCPTSSAYGNLSWRIASFRLARGCVCERWSWSMWESWVHCSPSLGSWPWAVSGSHLSMTKQLANR